MATAIHELRATMSAESRGLTDALENIIRIAGKAASAWESAAQRIAGAVSGIESTVNRSVTSFNAMGSAATANAALVVKAATDIRAAWAGAISGLGGRLPTITPGPTGGGGRSTLAERADDRVAASAVKAADRQAAEADRVASAQQRAAERGAAAQQRAHERIAASAQKSADRQAAEADRAASAQQRAAERAAERVAAAADRAAERAARALEQAAARAAAAADRTAHAWANASARLIASARDVGAAWVDAFNKALSAATRVSVVVGGTIAAIGGTVLAVGIKFNDTITSVTLSLTKLTGSGNIAAAMIEDLKKLAVEFPQFKFSDLAPMTQKLIALGFSAKEVVPWIRAIGDQVAAVGGSQEKFDRIVKAITDVKGKGKLFAQEANQFAEAGIPIWGLLAKQMNKTEAEVRALSAAGMIPAGLALDTLFNEFQKSAGVATKVGRNTVSGMLASIADVFEQNAGAVSKPFTDLILGTLTKLSDDMTGKTPAFVAFTDTVFMGFSRIANAISNALGTLSGGNDVWATAGAVVERVTGLIVQAIEAFTEIAPTLWAAAQGIGAVVGWFAKLAIESPNLTAALIAFQMAGLLGINSALLSVGVALKATITWLLSFATAAEGAGVAAAGAGAGMAALGLAAAALIGIGLGVWLSQQYGHVKAFNESIEKTIALTKQLQAVTGAEAKKELTETLAVADPKQRAEGLSDQEDRAKRNVVGNASQLKRQQDIVNIWDKPGLSATGNKILELEKATLAELQAKKLQYEAELAAVQRARQEDAIKAAAAAGKAEMDRKAEEAELLKKSLADVAETDAIVARKREKEEKLTDAMRKQEVKSLSKDAPQFDELRDYMDLGPTTDQLRGFMAKLPGFSQDVIDATAKMFDDIKKEAKDPANANDTEFLAANLDMAAKAGADAAGRNEHVKKQTTEFGGKLGAAGEAGVRAPAIADAQARFDSLVRTLADGTITVEQFDKGVQKLEKDVAAVVASDPSRMKEATDELAAKGINAAPLEGRFNALHQQLLAGTITLGQFKDRMKDVDAEVRVAGEAGGKFGAIMDGVGKNLPAADVAVLEARFGEMRKKLIEGKMAVDEFNGGMATLAERAAEMDLQRRAAGQFTPEEFRKALLERQAGIQGQQFGQQVDEQLAQQMLNAGLSMERIAELMGKLPSQWQKAMDERKRKDEEFKKNDWGAWGQRTERFAMWTNSMDGQIKNLRNQLAIVGQKFAFADTYRETQKVVAEMRFLNGQLNTLLAPRTPIVRETEATFLRDPSQSQQSSNSQIVVNLPQARVDSAGVAYEIATAVDRETKRRGRAAFN